jgi:uncharacterized protein YbaR (Trm112 family)
MYIDHVDSLRCTADHEEAWLVAAADEWREGRILRGRLGCPVCRVEYRIEHGVAHFEGTDEPEAESEGGAIELDSGEATVLRLAAQLDLGQPGGLVLLAGRFTRLADRVARLMEMPNLLLNAPPGVLAAGGSPILAYRRLPLASGVLRAAAIDGLAASSELVAEAVRVLRFGGRLLLRDARGVPEGISVIARDAHEIVGERTQPVASAPVSLGRRRAP